MKTNGSGFKGSEVPFFALRASDFALRATTGQDAGQAGFNPSAGLKSGQFNRIKNLMT